MLKVICLQCRDVGYTASPEYVRCQCGGKLVIIYDELIDEIQFKGDENESIISSQ